jgi:thiol:disulfide interchange protein DsbD
MPIFALPTPRLLACALTAGLLAASAARAQTDAAPQVRTEQVTATLLAWAPAGVPAGEASPSGDSQPVWVGLQIEHAPGWHTYWKNPGDSGMPTELRWTLPPGVQAGDIAWPLPRKIAIGPLANYGYEGAVLLPVPLSITPGYQSAPQEDALPVKLHASWLVCRQECIPQEGDFSLRLPLRSSTALAAAAFEAALEARPAPLQGEQQAAIEDGGQRLSVRVAGLPASLRGQTLELFAETPGLIVTAAALAGPGQGPSQKTWRQHWDGDTWTASLPVSPEREGSPAAVALALAAGGQSWRVQAPIAGRWPAPSPAADLPPTLGSAASLPGAASASTPTPAAAPWGAFLLALLGALVGGMTLNLMPCVFPVLAIKVLGFARHADQRRAHRASGLAYSAGVVLSFLALGALMLALRAAGAQLGWGFQLQSPWVVALLAALFTAIGLNLAGVFEFKGFTLGGIASLPLRHPLLDALLSGVLAVAIASPCTAPYMGAAIGLAVALPPARALAIFAALGLGMALPYLLASWVPQVARLLPRPGAWMQTFRQLMAFPMFATVVFLLWVLGQQSGIDGVAHLLTWLVLLAMLLWTLGLPPGRGRRWLAALALASLCALPALLGADIFRAEPAAPASQQNAAGRWRPWSPQAVQAALAAGQPVLVDFTAAWCITCQVNEKTTLARADVLAALDAARVQTFRADWTRRDDAISAELQRLGRSGVPAYLLQAPGKPPETLSELLSVGDVLDAVGRLGGGGR